MRVSSTHRIGMRPSLGSWNGALHPMPLGDPVVVGADEGLFVAAMESEAPPGAFLFRGHLNFHNQT